MKTKNVAKKKPVIIIVIAVLIACTLGALVFFIIDFRSYEKTVQRLKNKNPEKCSFLPDKLPEDATGWKKSSVPSILQGSGYTRIVIDCTEEYLDRITEQYEGRVEKAFYGYYYVNDTYPHLMIVTDKDCMYESSEYDENNSYSHPQYKYDYKVDDVSNIHFYDNTDDLYGRDGCIDDEKYDERSVNFSDILINKEKTEGVIVYILYDNDNWNHPHSSLVVVNRTNNTVTFLIE